MSYENILLNIEEGIATITLNRPDKLNAYIVAMGEDVVNAFDQLRDNEEVKVIILTGAGRGFCAGVDLEHLKAEFAGEITSNPDLPKLGEERFIRELPAMLATYPKPIIVAINGHAIGVGITMALPCDIRIAAEGSKIGLTFAKMGIMPGLGSTQLLQRVVGPAKAKELLLTAKIILAEEAAEIGLVNKVVPGEQLMEEALTMARQIAECKPATIAAIKGCLHYAATSTLEEAMVKEQEASAALRKK